jgi:hypothetical protein
LRVDPAGLAADRGEQRVVEGLGPVDVVAADHDVGLNIHLLLRYHTCSRARGPRLLGSVLGVRAAAAGSSATRVEEPAGGVRDLVDGRGRRRQRSPSTAR